VKINSLGQKKKKRHRNTKEEIKQFLVTAEKSHG